MTSLRWRREQIHIRLAMMFALPQFFMQRARSSQARHKSVCMHITCRVVVDRVLSKKSLSSKHCVYLTVCLDASKSITAHIQAVTAGCPQDLNTYLVGDKGTHDIRCSNLVALDALTTASAVQGGRLKRQALVPTCFAHVFIIRINYGC